MSGVMIALISGALMSIQGVFNTEVTKATSLWVSTSFVQLTALIVCLLAWAFTDRQSFLTLMEVPNKWTLLGGVIGAFITVTVVRSMADHYRGDCFQMVKNFLKMCCKNVNFPLQ